MATTGHGKDLVFKTGTAGSEGDISNYVDSVEWPWDYDDADVSAAGLAYKQSIPGQYGSEVKISGPFSTELHAIMQPLRGVVGKSAIYGPRGSTSGFYKLSATGWWEYHPPKGDVGDALRYEAVFHVSSANTEATWP
jgi:hypothetical protein